MRLNILNRLVIGNMIIISLAVFLVAHVIFKLEKLQFISKEIIQTDLKFLDMCEKLSDSLHSLVTFEKKFIISKDSDYYHKHKEIKNSFLQDVALLNADNSNEEIKTISLQIRFLFQKYLTSFESEARLIKTSPKGYDPSKSFNERDIMTKNIDYKIKQIVKIKNKEKSSKFLRSSTMISEVIKITIISGVVAIIMGIVISIANTRAITGSIFLLTKQTREISKGKFSHIPPNLSAPKEIGDLTRHFNIMCSRLKDLEVMKTDFISHFSHELRTPVTSIKEAASMLNMKLFTNDPKKEQDLTKLILYECERLMDSIERILDLSKMEVFQMEWKFERADLTKVVKKSLVKFIPVAQTKKVVLRFHALKNMPQILFDKKRIEEVINNLISNALKYTPQGGEVLVKIEINRMKNKAMVSVADNGCGIDKKNLEKIFEKFKRIDNGGETLRGTGLGLAIAKYIINEHKGKIWAESEYSKGTKIFFVLPLV